MGCRIRSGMTEDVIPGLTRYPVIAGSTRYPVIAGSTRYPVIAGSTRNLISASAESVYKRNTSGRKPEDLFSEV